MKKVLVTGSKGFIGKQLISHMTNNEVIGIDEEYLLCKDWKKELLQLLMAAQPDVVFHIGACSNTLEKEVNYMMVRNYETTKVLVEWCKNNEVPIIYSSSAANYGVNGKYPSNLYGWSKYAAEDYVLSNGGLALRYFNVYGPGESHKKKMASVACQMYEKYKDINESVGLFPKNPQRDFVYVRDVVSANLHAWKGYKNLVGKYYEVGSGKARPFEDVMKILDIPYFYYSEDEIPEGYQFYTCSYKKKWMDGWSPAYNLEKGLGEYKEYLMLKTEKIWE